MMEVNGAGNPNQRPQKPIYVFSWIFFYWGFSQKHCIEAVKFSFFKGVLGVKRGDEGGPFRVEFNSYC